jgi:hypothetical protein
MFHKPLIKTTDITKIVRLLELLKNLISLGDEDARYLYNFDTFNFHKAKWKQIEIIWS